MAISISSLISLQSSSACERIYISKPNLPLSVSRQSAVGGLKIHKIHLRIRAKPSGERELLVREADTAPSSEDIGIISIHHVGILCQNLDKSLNFYQNLLGLKINEARPHDKLPYRGAWLWVGDEMIHLMELPNPDSLTGRPEHGGRDRHVCIAIKNVTKLKEILDKAGINYTLSRSGRLAIFTRDPDGNALEFTQVLPDQTKPEPPLDMGIENQPDAIDESCTGRNEPYLNCPFPKSSSVIVVGVPLEKFTCHTSD